jgi:FAD/FMN-containing dehydrogenase
MPHTKERIKTRREFVKQSAMTGGMLAFGKFNILPTVKLAVDKDAINKLKNRFSGNLIVPGDPGYDQARRVFTLNPDTDKHPAIVAQCRSEEDVLRCIDFAHRQQMEVAVRSGNHSFLGWGSCDKGIVIDLSRMKGVAVDPAKRKAQVSTGNTAEEILAATATYGLATVLGECGTVGAGLALGGGLGHLSGKYGATCDNLVAARVITADGRTLKADAVTNEDLFWAIRGGGGNFGVATLFEYQLHPVGQVLAGSFDYPISKAKSVLRHFREFMATAPDELQTVCNLMSHPGGISVYSVYAGNLDEGERLLDSFRRFETPDRDSVKRMSFGEIYKPDQADEGKSDQGDEGMSCPFGSLKGTYIESLSDDAINLVIECSAQPPSSCGVVVGLDHYVHGQVCRVAPDATAFGLRKAGAIHFWFWVLWKEEAQASACMAWSKTTLERLRQYSSGRAYANYMSTTGEALAKSVYGSNYPRLAQLKKKYDPENFFHLNQNVVPA